MDAINAKIPLNTGIFAKLVKKLFLIGSTLVINSPSDFLTVIAILSFPRIIIPSIRA